MSFHWLWSVGLGIRPIPPDYGFTLYLYIKVTDFDTLLKFLTHICFNFLSYYKCFLKVIFQESNLTYEQKILLIRRFIKNLVMNVI